MQKFKDIPIGVLQLINQIDTDYKAEVIGAGLVDSGWDENRILLVRKHGDKKFVSKDIYGVDSEYSTRDLMEYLYIHTNRGGIYESLPEGVFHQPLNTVKKKTNESILEEIRAHREEEFFARRYFQPFEMVADQLLIDAQLYEHQFNKKNFHPNLVHVFSKYWDVLNLLSLKQAVLFIKVIPVMYRLVTDFNILSQVLTLVLDVPIKVCIGKQKKVMVNNQIQPVLGSWQLGISSTIGKEYLDGYKTIQVQVGPITPLQMKLFEYKQQRDIILNYLLNLILPINMHFLIGYTITKEETAFVLSHKQHKAYLGINTLLKK